MTAPRLNLYTVFHLNLAYSSIEEEQRLDVIRQCYWPLLKLARDYNLPFGIEATGYTLETINRIDPDWIAELKRLVTGGPCEFIGSGYSQIIGPLVPAMVNDWNQKLGMDVYESCLGIRPRVALVNEMAFSSGIVEHYLNHGYKAVIMEWNNPKKYHLEWSNDWKYFPQRTLAIDGRSIPVIWADSIAFQKFQRYAHDEIELDEYLSYLNSHISGKEGYFPIYANDIEIFNFRPGRYETEIKLDGRKDEWKRIEELFEKLIVLGLEFCSPSRVLDGLKNPHAGHLLSLQSSEQPIPVKKQEKYNINRWALTGRNDLFINTCCQQIYDALLKENNESTDSWKELCYLWSSDFRTHITSSRWKNYFKKLEKIKKQLNIKDDNEDIFYHHGTSEIKAPYKKENFTINDLGRFIIFENENIYLKLNKRKGLAIHELVFKQVHDKPILGTLEHGYYDDISLGADFYSGHSIIETPGEHKITDLIETEPEIFGENHFVVIRTKGTSQKVTFSKEFIINQKDIRIFQSIALPARKLQIIHPLHFTFNPEAWDQKSLFFQTHNGGNALETFKLGMNEIHHSDILSSLISSRHGLGATEGVMMIGDKTKVIKFKHSPKQAAIIPQIVYLPSENNYFFRLQYSAQELDETFVESNQKQTQHFNCYLNMAITNH